MAGQVELNVYDLSGKTVAVLVSGRQQAGAHQVVFRAPSLPSGIYLYRLKTTHYQDVKKMILIR